MNEKRERLVRQAHEDYRHPDTDARCPMWVLGLIYDAKVQAREDPGARANRGLRSTIMGGAAHDGHD